MQLSEYVKLIPTTRTVSPPGYPNIQRHVLTEEVQQLMRRLLDLMPDHETNQMCFFELKAENVVVDLQSGIPYLYAVFRTNYDNNLAQMNYASVEKIFRETIFSGAVASLPPDFQQLLRLMKTKGYTAPYLIQHHCSLVLPDDKKELFLRLYDHWNDIVRNRSQWSYAYVMNNLAYPPDWVRLIGQNQYLDLYYRGSHYNQVGSHPGKEVLRFNRNTYSHPLEHALDRRTGQQMYGQAELVEMLENELPLLLHSFQVALNDLGLLKGINVETFFR
jgi:hypothetical protein